MSRLILVSSKIGRNDACHCGSGQKYKKCCWELDQAKSQEGQSQMHQSIYNDRPPMSDLEIQKMMYQISKIVNSEKMTVDELNNFLVGRNADEIEDEYHRVHQKTAKNQAYEMILDAFTYPTSKKRIEAARKALEIDSDCAEAYLLFAEELSDSPSDELNYYELAINAARRSLGEKYFKENKGHFWGLHETRTYMRAKHMMADLLWDLHRQSDAINIMWELLELNPNDNQGIRYPLFCWLLTDNRLNEVEKLLQLYPEDGAACWEFNKLLYYIKIHGPVSAVTTQQAQIAIQSNLHVVKYFTSSEKIPMELADYYSSGSKEEAVIYYNLAKIAWLNTINALNFLTGLKTSNAKKSTKKKSTK